MSLIIFLIVALLIICILQIRTKLFLEALQEENRVLEKSIKSIEKIKYRNIPNVGTPVSYRYKDLEGRTHYRVGKVTQECPHFLPPSVQLTSNDEYKKDYRYFHMNQLGITWWLDYKVLNERDMLKVWGINLKYSTK